MHFTKEVREVKIQLVLKRQCTLLNAMLCTHRGQCVCSTTGYQGRKSSLGQSAIFCIEKETTPWTSMRTHTSVAEDVQFNAGMVLPFGETPAVLLWSP